MKDVSLKDLLQRNDEIVSASLSINCLSDDMLRCATERGYKTPSENTSCLYGNPAKFTHNYITEKYTMTVYDKNTDKPIKTYLL